MPDEIVEVGDIPGPVIVLRNGVVTGASPAASRLLGVEPDALVGARLDDLFTDDFMNLSGGTEIVARARSAPHRIVGMTATGVDVGDETGDRLIVTLRDLTTERRLSAVIDAVADSTLVLDADGALLWQSDALAARVPGGSANLGTHPVERLHPEDLPMVLEAFADLAGQPGGRIARVVRSRSIDNDDLWQLIELVGASRVDDPDLAGVVVQVRNIDAGSEIESTGQTEGPMLSMAEAAPVGILLMNRIERVMYASQVGRALLGFGEVDDATDWRDRVVPSGRGAIDALVADGLVGGPPTTITTQFVLPEGTHLWMRVRVAPHLDARGQPVGAIVALEDVTAEVEARTESERLLQMLDATSDYVAIFRPNGDILHLNQVLSQVLEDHRRAGGTGRLGDLIADRDAFIQRGLEAVEVSDTWHGELMMNVAPGQTIPVSALGVVGRDEDGEVDWVAMVARDISELKEAEERLRRLATSDHLTGLANRALFTEQLEEVVARGNRTGRGLAVLFCDLDRFKEVNDEHGHADGDDVLVEIANRLLTIIRGDDMVARVGGDEFVVLCDGSIDPDALAALAERIIDTVHQPIDVVGGQVQVGISIGVAIANQPGVTGDRILTSADQAMYRAKATGGNRYRVVEVTS